MKCLYVSHNGLLDPLGQSQVIPYVRCLISAGHSFTLISYEKEDRPDSDIRELEKSLNDVGVEWVRLPFGSGKVAGLKRIAAGVSAIRRVSRRVRPDIVHLRGFMPALIYKLSFLGIPYIYDFRSFVVGELVDSGRVREGALLHRGLKWLDALSVSTASGLVVLEKSAEELLRNTYRVPGVPLKVIRTSTEVALYRARSSANASPLECPIRFVYLGGARQPYRPDLALRFVLQLMRSGVDCRVDFINERDHEVISMAVVDTQFPQNRITVRSMAQRDIPGALEEYDAGLIFIDTSKWRRVCSPTKLGEYLAAGLPVVALTGLAVLDEFAASTECVTIVEEADLHAVRSSEKMRHIVALIRHPGVGGACQKLAREECSLDMAGRLYADLYREIEVRI